MKRKDRYGATSLKKDFPDEATCLEYIFDARHSRACSCGGTYKPVKGRKQYQCSKCRFQIAPTAGTVFHKSDTPLTVWFRAILAFSNAKSGISAKELEREIETTYKTAWRILMLIRKALADQGKDKLKGTVELDTAFFGGRYPSGTYNKHQKAAIAAKSIIFGAVERGGGAKVRVVPNTKKKGQWKFVNENVEEGTQLMTDGARVYEKLQPEYGLESVQHSKKEYVRGDVYINTIESFWAHVKRSVAGTHKTISKKYLQSYLDGFVFHRNNSYSDKQRFAVLLGSVLLASK